MVDTEQAGGVHGVQSGVQQNGGDHTQHAAHQVPGFPGVQPGQDINFANEVGLLLNYLKMVPYFAPKIYGLKFLHQDLFCKR